MRIGIVPVLSGLGGGVYQYSLTMLRTLYEWQGDGGGDEFAVFTREPEHPFATSLKDQGWVVTSLEPPPPLKQQALRTLDRLLGEGPHREAWRWVKRQVRDGETASRPETPLPDPDQVQFRSEYHDWFSRWKPDLMIYPVPRSLSFETEIPFVMSIHDLQHRLQPEFPEVSAGGEWERREYLFRNAARYATLLVADSEVGKEDILNFYGPYGVTPDQVRVLPFLPASYLAVDVPESERQQVRATYRLPERYLFYPAQFWPHKNHTRIVQALGLLEQEHRCKVPVVFCGSYANIHYNTFNDVMSLVSQLGIEDQVHYLGYVPDEDMPALYAEAVALVMPTFFGPTNIPVLEAWAFGCPVLTSDIRGIREQAGDAAILVDPRSVEAIADGLYRLWTDGDLRRTLANRGRQRLAACTPEDYRRRLIEIVEEAKARVRAGENPRIAVPVV